MYKTVLLKLSGEAIAASDYPFDNDIIESIAYQIKEISEMGIRVGVVIGGGNICRGRLFEQMGFDVVLANDGKYYLYINENPIYISYNYNNFDANYLWSMLQ